VFHEFQKDFGLVDKPYKGRGKLKYGKLCRKYIVTCQHVAGRRDGKQTSAPTQ
jgi:hypothetical protein